ncbi:MAG: DMT family transporter [Candidatus Nanopelagicaceae bacterium]|jgi:drug/metabolite transporter (DMT)-like permease
MKSLMRFAPIVFVLLWSTGFVGAKYILPFAEPFVFLTIRYAVATVLLVVIAKAIGESLSLTRDQVWQSISVGVFLQVIYIGGVFYAVHLGVPAGITSAIVSLQPIVVSVLAVKFLGEKIRWVQAGGLILGLLGVSLLLLPKVFTGDFSPNFSGVGILSCFLALSGTTAGYLLQKKSGTDIPFLPGTAVQFAAATVIFALAATFTEEWKVEVTTEFLLALAWIVIALSIGSIFLLFYLLKHDSASSVSSLYYLVPPLTAIEAFVLFREKISPIGLLGMALAALGTILVTRKASR